MQHWILPCPITSGLVNLIMKLQSKSLVDTTGILTHDQFTQLVIQSDRSSQFIRNYERTNCDIPEICLFVLAEMLRIAVKRTLISNYTKKKWKGNAITDFISQIQ